MYLIENHLTLNIRDNPEGNCWKCHGEGIVIWYDDEGNPVEETCPECDGAGIVEYRLFW